VETYKILIKEYPDEPWPHYLLGKLYWRKLDDKNEALKVIDRAIRKMKRFPIEQKRQRIIITDRRKLAEEIG
jgi:hypothetical protein